MDKRYEVPKYKPLEEISKRARAWLTKKLQIGGIVFDHNETGQIVLWAKIDGKEAEGVLSLAQAKALRTLLDLEILKAEAKE